MFSWVLGMDGWMDKAEAFHLHTMERGANPSYETREILMEGWVNKGLWEL